MEEDEIKGKKAATGGARGREGAREGGRWKGVRGSEMESLPPLGHLLMF